MERWNSQRDFEIHHGDSKLQMRPNKIPKLRHLFKPLFFQGEW